jgi:hypothetical protein
VPYADLPAAQKAKDGIYIAVVRAFAVAFGETVQAVPATTRSEDEQMLEAAGCMVVYLSERSSVLGPRPFLLNVIPASFHHAANAFCQKVGIDAQGRRLVDGRRRMSQE